MISPRNFHEPACSSCCGIIFKFHTLINNKYNKAPHQPHILNDFMEVEEAVIRVPDENVGDNSPEATRYACHHGSGYNGLPGHLSDQREDPKGVPENLCYA